jgi:hypothetical protein
MVIDKKSFNKEELVEAVSQNKSIAGVLRKLGLKPVGGNYRTIKKYLNSYEIDTSHFTGKGHLKGKNCPWKKKQPLGEILIKYSTYSVWHLKRRLINEGVLEYKCAVCGIDEWNGRALSLHLDHRNGNSFDHRLENLQLLCPNCHSQTDTYCAKNIKKLP